VIDPATIQRILAGFGSAFPPKGTTSNIDTSQSWQQEYDFRHVAYEKTIKIRRPPRYCGWAERVDDDKVSESHRLPGPSEGGADVLEGS